MAGWRRRIVREVRWAAVSLVLPFVIIVALELALSRSPLPFWRRLTTLEDTCAYGACFIIPALIYALATWFRLVRFRSRA